MERGSLVKILRNGGHTAYRSKLYMSVLSVKQAITHGSFGLDDRIVMVYDLPSYEFQCAFKIYMVTRKFGTSYFKYDVLPFEQSKELAGQYHEEAKSFDNITEG